MPVMMMPIVTRGCSWRGTQQVIQNVNDGADVTLRSAVPVLQCRIQCAAERTRIHTLPMVMHALYYRALPASRVLLRGELLQLLREVPGRLSERSGVEGSRLRW